MHHTHPVYRQHVTNSEHVDTISVTLSRGHGALNRYHRGAHSHTAYQMGSILTNHGPQPDKSHIGSHHKSTSDESIASRHAKDVARQTRAAERHLAFDQNPAPALGQNSQPTVCTTSTRLLLLSSSGTQHHARNFRRNLGSFQVLSESSGTREDFRVWTGLKGIGIYIIPYG